MADGPKLVTCYRWWRGDLEDFIKEIYGVEWDGQAAMDYPAQNTYYTCEVEGTRESVVYSMNWIEEDMTFEHAEKIIEQFKNGEFEGRRHEWPYALPSLGFLLEWLCFQKHIPAGDYMITVWW
jgi:hypothetical protein